MKFRSIAVEGPIGVGKSSLVNLLAEKFNAYKVLEDLENPFLKAFYEDMQAQHPKNLRVKEKLAESLSS